jgi:hypothetical protein
VNPEWQGMKRLPLMPLTEPCLHSIECFMCGQDTVVTRQIFCVLWNTTGAQAPPAQRALNSLDIFLILLLQIGENMSFKWTGGTKSVSSGAIIFFWCAVFHSSLAPKVLSHMNHNCNTRSSPWKANTVLAANIYFLDTKFNSIFLMMSL